MLCVFTALAVLRTLAGAESEAFNCHKGLDLPPIYEISPQEAQERNCCIDLPCNFTSGCWADQMPPLYSAPRVQAITEEQAFYMQNELLFPAVSSGAVTKTFVDSMPEHGWYRISVPKDKFQFFYDGIKDGFRRTFNAELQLTIDLDIFYIDDFDNHWSSNETYESLHPGAGYWIHNDCNNFRICYEETGIPADQFTGDGVAFVLPVALPSLVNFRDGHEMMPAALELYNISDGHRDETGKLLRPQNRQWASVHRYNLGEIIFFNAFRWHSGHVPRAGDIPDDLNPLRNRAETVGFAAKHVDGHWVLFRMCKGSTDDKVTKKILKTDKNAQSTGEAKASYDLSEEEIALRNEGLNYMSQTVHDEL